jgi:hypothetical protein
MRATLLAGLALLAANPALAQSRGGIDSLNATNERLSERSEARSIEQRQQFQNNQTRTDVQRNELLGSTPTPSPGVIVVPGRH